MEQNLPIIAKKFWSIVKVAYFMLRKGISKAKLFSDLNMMLKRGKIAGKAAMHNLIFHHHHAQEPQLAELRVQLQQHPGLPAAVPPQQAQGRERAVGGGGGDGEQCGAVAGAAGVRADADGEAAEDNGLAVPVERDRRRSPR
ncbi:uncharacterized protein LOC130992493 [Salvia miltiorrhiza]|uniref:uncharacterized protein LOC130992493 n=1 Tax=Salvia miltiorrhiza TaxID=226208 RepID=UPI0025AD85DD|nr:uncharacterized protein LOC130992493 [Salvia miltiorrhiza]